MKPNTPLPIRRIGWILFLYIALGALGASTARAETTVPLDLQVELLKRVVRFERGLLGRAGEKVKIAVIVAGNPKSATVAGNLSQALRGMTQIGDKTVALSSIKYTSPAALIASIKAEGINIAYLPPGLEADLPAIVAALAGVPVITVSTDGDQVDRGAVLGFELVSAHPKLALNLGQARKQGLDFNSELFRLARVVK